MKKCEGCKEVKPLTDYPTNKTSKSGYRKKCKVCTKVALGVYRDKKKKRVSEVQICRDNNRFLELFRLSFNQ